MLCQYKNLFGEPNTGLHRYRLFNIALVDLGLTVLAAWLISWFFRVNFWITLLVLLVLGVVAHRVFCVRTTVDKLLFRQESV